MLKSTCSVAATYKPPMLVPRARLPAGAFCLFHWLVISLAMFIIPGGPERHSATESCVTPKRESQLPRVTVTRRRHVECCFSVYGSVALVERVTLNCTERRDTLNNLYCRMLARKGTSPLLLLDDERTKICELLINPWWRQQISRGCAH